jgi:putative drug exporter of the RND superfamily
MLGRLAVLVVRRPKVVLLATLTLLGIGIVFGGTVSEKLGVGGFIDPAAESTRADAFLDQTFGTTPNLVLQVFARDGAIESPDVAAAADRVQRLVEAEAAAKVIGSFRQDATTDLRSRDGHSGLILVHVGGTTEDAAKVANRIIEKLPTDDPKVALRAGGTLGVQKEIDDRVNHDLVISESIALPISLGVLVIVFGGLVAAFLPLAVGLTSIVTTMLVLLVMTSVTDVSVHALTVATAFGLGLSIDFGLLMVSRFREERDRGRDHQSAIIATVTTAGRTIVFSAATVTLAMAGLLVFPTYFLRSVGITASAVVILSALSAIVVVPALLALLGKRIDALAVVRRAAPLSADSVFWRRCARAVTRRPLLWSLPVIAVLLALGIPFLSVQLATPDERALPSNSNARLLAESLRDDYPTDTSQAVTLLARTNVEALDGLVTAVSRMHGVVRVDGPASRQSPAYALVYLSVDAQSDSAQQLVRDIRAKIADHQVEVGGATATLIDTSAAVADRLGPAILLIALATFVLLFLFTGSIVVPIKALVLNLLVLSAVLGTMVWIFQNGHLASALGITPAPLNLSMVVLLCCIAFSLSVDYEIFLLSRMKEARDSGLSNNDAIVVALGRVGRIISCAAILLTITLVAFANGLSFMKMFGIGTALAVIIDATVIRGVVVPAFLRVAGDLNWWAPRPLKWLHSRIGFSEAPSAAASVPRLRPGTGASEVEVVPGRHLVANVNGTVIVVANRGAVQPSPKSVAAQHLWELVEIVRRTDRQRLASAISQLCRGNRAAVDFGIVTPTAAGLDVFLSGGVTVALDNGGGRTLLHGATRPFYLHRSVRVPAVAAVVSVDETGQRPPAPAKRPGVYTLAAGTAPGQGAVIWSTRAASATTLAPAVVTPGGSDMSSTAPTVTIRRPLGCIILDDNSRFEIDRDCVIGRAPDDSDAVRRGLHPVPIEDRTGGVSRAHAEIRRANGEVLIVDRGSTNGVFLRKPGGQNWIRLVPWKPAVLLPGAFVRIGSRILQLQACDGPVGSNSADRGEHREHREQPPSPGQVPDGGHVHHNAGQPGAECATDQLHGVDRCGRRPGFDRVVHRTHDPRRQVRPGHTDANPDGDQRERPDRDHGHQMRQPLPEQWHVHVDHRRGHQQPDRHVHPFQRPATERGAWQHGRLHPPVHDDKATNQRHTHREHQPGRTG